MQLICSIALTCLKVQNDNKVAQPPCQFSTLSMFKLVGAVHSGDLDRSTSIQRRIGSRKGSQKRRRSKSKPILTILPRTRIRSSFRLIYFFVWHAIVSLIGSLTKVFVQIWTPKLDLNQIDLN